MVIVLGIAISIKLDNLYKAFNIMPYKQYILTNCVISDNISQAIIFLSAS